MLCHRLIFRIEPRWHDTAQREVAGSKEGQDPTVAPAPAPSASSDFRKAVRSYGQRKPKLDPVADSDAPMVSQDVLSLLAGKRR